MKEIKNLILDENFKARNSVVGQTIGTLKVLKVVGYTTEHSKDRETKNAIYEVECECGQIFQARARDIKQEKIKSCGCKKKERARLMGLANSFENKEEAPTNSAFHTYKNRAINREMDFELSREEFTKITSLNCHYCDSEPKQNFYYYSPQHKNIKRFNGIDRLDSTKGYIKDNIVPCCKTCNFAKNDLTLEEFNEWIFRLLKHQINKGELLLFPSTKDKEEIDN